MEELINKISEDTPVNNDVKKEGVDLEVVKKVLNTLSGQTAGTAISALTSAAMLLPAPMLMMMTSALNTLVKTLMKEAFIEMLLDKKSKEGE